MYMRCILKSLFYVNCGKNQTIKEYSSTNKNNVIIILTGTFKNDNFRYVN